ncbi:BLUF domain-containing protein (plasmid) [Paracoccus liaowanqingii]|uniref:BLUF domain-containing protein n=1 Tax=Paracoccus liaowanqingii TaxID=2560053 RepID=A0A4Y5SSG6_9RHOB|nr:BLUF domain-containing protein [Paracoccus liaowanqingii]QDA35654.1 BLUF domain-containing protein [Paracoccus liaowanqingii]
MQLTRLIYASNHGGIEREGLEDILIKSQANNKQDGITGLLISSDEDFIQLIEGGRTVVAKCFMRIMQDDRHQNIKVLLASPIESRLFSSWDMQSISASQINTNSLNQYLRNGSFDSDEMSHEDIEELFSKLSKELEDIKS